MFGRETMIDIADFGLTPPIRHAYEAGIKKGHWTLLAFGIKNQVCYAVAQCDCGSAPRVISAPNVFRGLSTNCGCVRRAKLTTHGLASRNGSTRTGIYRVWVSMVRRCTDPLDAAYDRYGGRGIAVCDRWQSVANFIADMGPTYAPKLTIERRDNDAGYSPDNCYWATKSEQTRNRRTTIRITHEGETKTLAEWSEQFGIRYSRLYQRLSNGWPFLLAATSPSNFKQRRVKRRSPSTDIRLLGAAKSNGKALI